MSQFPHLNLAHKLYGSYKFRSVGSKKKNPITQSNLNNRAAHAKYLKDRINSFEVSWDLLMKERKKQGLPNIDENIKPIFLQVDLDSFTIESLRHWGIEVISEEDNGYIIGVSTDNFKSLKEKIEQFLNSKGRYKDTAAKLFTINEGTSWRLEHILTPELATKWHLINDDFEYTAYAGIACNVYIEDYPNPKELTEEEFQLKVNNWNSKKDIAMDLRDDMSIQRHSMFENLLTSYGGTLLTSYIDFNDSYYVSFRVCGKGLKDIALSYQYLYELGEIETYRVNVADGEETIEINPNLHAPEETDPKICVVDSGIQEGHKLLQLAIDPARSYSFVERDVSVSDKVSGGGHGTRVAGAILYGDSIPRKGEYKLPFWIHNARVLNENNELTLLDPAQLMINVCDKFSDSRIFNLSIANENGFLGTHMPPWAATIDKISYEQDKLFVIAAGNISLSSTNPLFQGLKEIMEAGLSYPDFLLSLSSNTISSPGVSAFGITVGSICIEGYEDADKRSFGAKNYPSSFSRTGLGLWNIIKPDVVEYGGDFVYEKLGSRLISNEATISPELVCSTRDGGAAISKSAVGTSYAAPKVTHIAGWLQKLFPTLNTNSYRALIIQSARLPEEKWKNPSLTDIRHFGYGIPSLNRATQNSPNRITFLSEGSVHPKSADIFMVKVPKEINRPGLDNEILIEITIAFKVPVRRTRKYTKSYLSSWLSWEVSNPREDHQEFCDRVIKSMDERQSTDNKNATRWMIWDRGNNGTIKEVKRQDGTVQKDWTIVRSNQLPDEFSVAVVGHTGWNKDLQVNIPYSVVVSFESLSEEIPVYQLFEIENRVEIEPELEIEF